MPRSRPASSPLSFHRHTGQFYVTRGGRRVYLGAEHESAMEKYHRLALGIPPALQSRPIALISAKELANRFVAAQQANWGSGETLTCYRNWLGRFLEDHPGLRAADLSVEMLAAWKLSLRRRKYAPRSINHYLGAVRALYHFAEDTELLETIPRFKRIKNEPAATIRSNGKPVYGLGEIRNLLTASDLQMQGMILLGLNCGFGPKDIHDLTWNDIDGERVTLPRSKTGVCQTFLLWPETQRALNRLREERRRLIDRMGRRGRSRSDGGRIFVTKYWRPWRKDAVAEQFRKLCERVDVPCYGFYRLRHCASTAISLVANPHVQRRFMRHTQLQQQVTYTHTPDDEVDAAICRARGKLLGNVSEDPGNGHGREEVVLGNGGEQRDLVGTGAT